ncbi:MAG: FAD-dependent thymidylate synthase [Thermoprotei archaeon]|nr:MAG: FAD-dependent thymidylate synthase [Thermoprotei archaeon]
MVKVTLIAYNTPIYGDRNPRRLPVLAAKVSTGKLLQKGFDYYLSENYPLEKASEWIKAAARGFPSILEHVVFTFLIEDISRVTSHQLVRHRIASYTQESQRYSVVEEDYVTPESIKNLGEGHEIYRKTVEEAFRTYRKLLERGIPYEDARYVLPQAVKTRILFTVNLRELLHIASLRLDKKAQWEIREVARLLIKEATKVIPELKEIVACKQT